MHKEQINHMWDRDGRNQVSHIDDRLLERAADTSLRDLVNVGFGIIAADGNSDDVDDGWTGNITADDTLSSFRIRIDQVHLDHRTQIPVQPDAPIMWNKWK